MVINSGDEAVLDSHRREIVVVFCDLRGFTPFAESNEPEEVMAVLAEYHAALGELIFQFGGTLERFTGDGLMVFFNDPIPIDDPARRAVEMALAMRDASRSSPTGGAGWGTTSASGSGSPRDSPRWAGSATKAVSTTPRSAASPTWPRGCAGRRFRAGAGLAAGLRGVEDVAAGKSAISSSAASAGRSACSACHSTLNNSAEGLMTSARARTAQRTAPRLADLATSAKRRFAELQERMPKVWDAWRRDLEGESVVVVPSVSLDRAGPGAGSLDQAFEERLLFLLLLLRQPRLKMIYVTSMPINPSIIEYYLALLPGVIPSHARARLSLIASATPRRAR